jgi:hypothetical protein
MIQGIYIDKAVRNDYILSPGINRKRKSGHNSVVEYELPKLGVAGSNPVARFFFFWSRPS